MNHRRHNLARSHRPPTFRRSRPTARANVNLATDGGLLAATRCHSCSAGLAGPNTAYAYEAKVCLLAEGRDTNGDGWPEGTTVYHVDPSNMTGYAQTIEEETDANGDGKLQAAEVGVAFTLGADVLAQATRGAGAGGAARVLHLLYDAHGSTRAVLNAAVPPMAVGILQSYAYAAYGSNLGLGLGGGPLTALRYAGESIDPLTGLSFNRARWYDPSAGRFNRVDPWAGDAQRPQTLNKYAYAHDDPISNSDPSGLMTFTEILGVSAIVGFLTGAIVGGIRGGPVGAVVGGLAGAVVAPIVTAGVILGGVATSASLFYFANIVFSPQVASFAIATTVTAYAAYRSGQTFENIDPAAPDADRQLLAAQVELGFTLLGWAIAAVALGRSYQLRSIEAPEIRTAYNVEAGKAAQLAAANEGATGVALENATRQVYQIRHNARLGLRGKMSQWIDRWVLEARDFLQYGNKDGPTFEFLVDKAKGKGLVGDAIYRYILGSAARTNEAVNTATLPQPSKGTP